MSVDLSDRASLLPGVIRAARQMFHREYATAGDRVRERDSRRTWPGVVLACGFVALYGTGFVGAKYGLPYAGPFTFLTLRFGFVSLVLSLAAVVLRRPWPASRRALAHQAVAGSLLMACFSAGVFVAIHLGISPAVAALVISLQPILVGLASPWLLKETIRARQYLGLILGFVGVSLVLGESLVWAHISWLAAACCVVGLLGVTGGNLYQKRFCANMDLIAGGAIHTGSSAILCAIGAFATETWHVEWTTEFVIALGWMAVVVSMGAMTLLYVLLRRNAASRVASVFYLVPVSAAVSSFLVHGTVPGASEILGAGIVGIGVALATYPLRSQTLARVPAVSSATVTGGDPGSAAPEIASVRSAAVAPEIASVRSAVLATELENASSGAVVTKAAVGAALVELDAGRLGLSTPTTIRFHGHDGERLEVEIAARAGFDLVALAEAFWRRRG